MSGSRELDTEEIARVLRLYEGPAEPRLRGSVGARRRSARPVLAIVALVFAAVATASILGLVTGRDDGRTHDAIAPNGCAPTLVFGGKKYVARAVTPGRMQIGRALGSGVLRRCGSRATAASAMALAGVDARNAVGVEGAPSVIYVGPSCAHASAARLLRCVRTSP